MNLTGYKYIDSRNGYEIYRKIVNGKGRWAAKRSDGYVFRITYHQALGYDPIDNIEALRMELGKALGIRRY